MNAEEIAAALGKAHRDGRGVGTAARNRVAHETFVLAVTR